MASRSSQTMRIDILPDAADAPGGNKEAGGTYPASRNYISDLPPAPAQPESQYRKLLQSIYDAVLITDIDGTIIDANGRAADFFLCDRQSLFGKRIIELISGSDESLLAAIKSNLARRKYTLIEGECTRSDGTTFPSEVAVNRIDLSDNGEMSFFVRDITIRRREHEELEKAVARLEEHDRQRSQFISNVSHELRTPLTSMMYAISNMLKGVVGPVSEDTRRYLEMLDVDCKRLLSTVNDILDLRKIEANKFTIARARVLFHRLVKRAAESLRFQSEAKSVTLDMPPNAGKWFVNCDPKKMERVILNIVGNAVKFTPGGGRVTVTVSDDGTPGGFVAAHVTDTGIGIPKEAISRVTEPYFRVGERVAGTGLGLAIAKEIVERHGGKIEIRSPAPGQDSGTRVSVLMPLAEAPVVLVVDDEKNIRHLLDAQLSSHGYRVLPAADGKEAVEKVQSHKPDAVILDLAMPVMDGTEAILNMKGNKETRAIPVVVVTGVDIARPTFEILHGFGIPAVRKPWQEEEILDRLEEALIGKAVFH